jgi:hypothetical protein
MLLAVDPAFTKERAQRWLLGGLAVLLLVSAIPIWDIGDDVWRRRFLVGGIALAFFLVLVPVALALAAKRGLPRPAIAAAAALALGLVIGIGWNKSDDYVHDRYQAATAPSDFPEGIKNALAFFNREDPHDARIAVVGGRPGFKQYVLYGNDLSNYVQYVAQHGPHGTFRPIASEAAQKGEANPADVARQCETWRQALNDGNYDYAVIGPDQRTQSNSPVEAAWTIDPNAQKLEESDMVSVFRLKGELNPATCTVVARLVGPNGAQVIQQSGKGLGVAKPESARITPPKTKSQ